MNKYWYNCKFVTFLICPFCGTPDLGSSFWGMVLILASTKELTTQIAAGCFVVALIVVLFLAKNVSTKLHFVSYILMLACTTFENIRDIQHFNYGYISWKLIDEDIETLAFLTNLNWFFLFNFVFVLLDNVQWTLRGLCLGMHSIIPTIHNPPVI